MLQRRAGVYIYIYISTNNDRQTDHHGQYVCALTSEWRGKGMKLKLRLTDQVSTAVVTVVRKKNRHKKTLVSRSRAYGDIVHVPDGTQ